MREAYADLWWVPVGHRPSVAEAKAKLERLRAEGSSPDAFTFKKPFPEPVSAEPDSFSSFDGTCPTT